MTPTQFMWEWYVPCFFMLLLAVGAAAFFYNLYKNPFKRLD